MKATDLMIGDWVQSFPDYCRVDGIICLREEHTAEEKWMAIVHLGGNRYEQVKVDILEPIPLTSEILEKNGFKKVDAIIYSTPRVGVNYEYRITQEGLRVLVNNSCVGAPTCTSIKTCRYVHEVQHMIKDCDITREIELK